MALVFILLASCNKNEDNNGTTLKSYPVGTVHCLPGGTEVVEVLNPVTGRTWMDRNLGAAQAATSPSDEAAHGDLYQWGRFSDGHQCRNSTTSDSVAMNVTTNNSSFIIENSNWLFEINNSLWQGVDGINNPCPTGFRLPTEAEFIEERNSWISNDLNGAFSSPLKLTASAGRDYGGGFLYEVGEFGSYWTSDVSDNNAKRFTFSDLSIVFIPSSRGYGNTVRCIKD